MIVYGITDKGLVRKENQDNIYTTSNEEIPLYIIADGMGGANAGDVASINTIRLIREYIEKYYSQMNTSDMQLKELLSLAIQYANNEVYLMSKKNKEYEGMGTTLIVLLIVNNKLYIGHIGDSRLYRIRKGLIRKITKDHSYVQKLLDDKTITKKEAKNHPKKNMLIKVLGCEPYVEPDIMVKKLLPEDYILLATDGLTNMVKDKEILQTVEALIEPKAICKKLVDVANTRGGLDNISVIIIDNN